MRPHAEFRKNHDATGTSAIQSSMLRRQRVLRPTAERIGRRARIDRGRDDVPYTIGEFPYIMTSQAGGLDRCMDDEFDLPWARHQSAFPHDVSAADHRYRNYRKTGLDRDEKESPLEAPNPPVRAARALRKHDQGVPLPCQTCHLAKCPDACSSAVHQQVPGISKVPPQDGERPQRRLRERPQRRLRDDPQLKRHVAKQDRDDPQLNVRACAARRSCCANTHTRCRQNQPRPGPGTPVGRAPRSVEERRDERNRSERNGVHRNSRYQPKDRAPPMKRGNGHASKRIQNGSGPVLCGPFTPIRSTLPELPQPSRHQSAHRRCLQRILRSCS